MTKTKTAKQKYGVQIPIAGSIYIEVEAENETEAAEVAWEAINEKGEEAGELEWESLDTIAEGNVCHAPCHSVTVDKLK